MSGNSHPPTLYGHVHIAKTAGTSLNVHLASQYERVCGHKGYSYDAFQANLRMKDKHDVITDVNDTYNKVFALHHRQRVPTEIMHEIGYEDCDWVSLEAPSTEWARFQTWPFPVELHVPCRDPVDHLMSQCNHAQQTFRCTDAFESDVKACTFEQGRFSWALTNMTNVNVKCYRYEHTFPHYVAYMTSKLQRKLMPSEATFRSTNKNRTRADECVWSDPDMMTQVRQHMIALHEYYAFCEMCLGSSQELVLLH